MAEKNKNWLKQLQKNQNRLLKILFFKKRIYNTNLLHREANILKVYELAILRLILHVFDNKQQLIRTRTYTLRNQMNIGINNNTYNYINRVVDEAIIKWNNIPAWIKEIEIRDKFKTTISNEIPGINFN